MKDNKKILAIIPARGGSKGLPGKNIKKLMGKPLIGWTIEQALNSKSFDRVTVNTDDPEIARIAKKFNAEVPFMRPKKLAEDKSPISDTIIYTLDWFRSGGEEFDVVVILEPTSPLRKKGDLRKAVKTFLKNYKKADSLVSLGEVHLENPYITKLVRGGFVKPFCDMGKVVYQRQQLPAVYFPYGVIYASKAEAFRRTKTFYQHRTVPYFIERWQNYEIDDGLDFAAIEKIMGMYKKDIC